MFPNVYSKTLILGLLVILVFSFACRSDSNNETNKSATAPTTDKDVVEVLNQDPGGSGSYTFKPNKFTFDKGQTVTFKMSAETEYHTFTVDKLKIDEDINADEIINFKVTFNETGTFELYCIVHKANGMVGEIVVK
jgi:plastocyanin